MVALLSRLGTGIVIFILIIVCVALAVSEPDSWFTREPQPMSQAADVQKKPRFNPADLIRVNDDNSEAIVFPEDPPKAASAVSKKPSAAAAASVAKAVVVPDLPDEKNFAEAEPKEVFRAPEKAKAPSVGVGKEKPKAPASVPVTEKPKAVPAASRVRKPVSTGIRQPAVDIPLFDEGEDTDIERFLPPRKYPLPEQAEENAPVSPARKKPAVAAPKKESPLDEVEPLGLEEAADVAGITLQQSPAPVSSRKAAATRADMKEPEKITKQDVVKEAKKMASAINKNTEAVQYVYPNTNLLKRSKSAGADSRAEVEATCARLENALHSFGIFSQVVNITQGPTVTRYDIELEQGVKLTKVTNLSSDIALNLGVSNVRIAPIPDEISTVGIEVPNKIVNTVGLREIIESENFQSAKSRLTFAIGKDIGGNAICGNIAKLPHLLIAGTTGSGKSVCMNSLIISLLYKSRPDEVKFIMIDPKMVELGIYNSIPHLYVPVVTDPKKAAGALQWAVVEMLKRYRLFSEAGVRDLETYNNYCRNNGEEPLPQMVIVIDELADLMMAASKEVEESICRIAQMGRASGQHLVIATQRPSADVITGLMKANIPSRIAFAVSSTLESRIILDQGGADKLIGHGDMLYAPIGCGKPLRVQGAFVSDDEREKIINFISKNSVPSDVDNEDLMQYMDNAALDNKDKKGSKDSSSSADTGNSIAGEYDEMLPQAAEVVLEMKQCSVSMLQRRLKLGYSRAARIVDQMEELGIVGPYEGAKPRSVPIDREGWQALQVKLGIASEDDFALAAGMNEAMEDSDADE
ncbi:MAG: DNA translocase FtsK [Oscillospiraceae bacterium]|nr:DNA translocase FtsK [Oscillospiraceae bacterium]